MPRLIGRVLALALIIFAPTAHSANLTLAPALPMDRSWVQIGTGPASVQGNGGDIEVVQATSAPAAGDIGETLRNLAPARRFTLPQPIYGRLSSTTTAKAIVTPEASALGSSAGSPLYAADANNKSYQGAAQLTVGGTPATTAYRAIAASCTAAGTLNLLMADGSTLYWDVSPGYQYQPFAATQITSSTATCSRYQGFN